MHSRSRKSHPVRSIQRPHRSVPAPIRTHLSIPSTSDNGQVEGAQKVRSYPSVSAADGIHHYDKTQLMPASPPASSSASPLLPSFSLPPALQPTATSKGALLHSTVSLDRSVTPPLDHTDSKLCIPVETVATVMTRTALCNVAGSSRMMDAGSGVDQQYALPEPYPKGIIKLDVYSLFLDNPSALLYTRSRMPIHPGAQWSASKSSQTAATTATLTITPAGREGSAGVRGSTTITTPQPPHIATVKSSRRIGGTATASLSTSWVGKRASAVATTAGPSIGKLVRPARRCVTARPLSIPYTAEPTSMAAGAIYTPLLLPMRKSSSSNSNNSGGSVSVSASSVGSDVQSWKQLRLRRLLSYTYEAPNHHCVSQCQGGYATSQGCNSSQQCSLCTSGNNGNDQGQTVPSMPIQDSGLPWISNTRGYDNTVNGRSAGIAGKRLRDSGSVDGYTYLSESDDTLAGSDVAKDGGSGRGVIIESNRGCILKRARRGGRRSVISKDPIQWSKSAPLDIPSTAIGFHLLSTDEVQTCSVLRLQPETYLRIKDIMLTARAQRGVFKKREAQRWCRIDVNKTARIYDWFVRLGWLDHPEY
ncbi:hypothetical protein BASA62_001976 [Batrachochytrium salamandrivorans]|nr:hypothetical protein BASA62_001976 [Batrachochytrium salamandrivorans]